MPLVQTRYKEINMKIHRKTLSAALLALVVMAAPFAADARPFGHNGPGYHAGYGMNNGPMQQLPQEKLEQLYAMRLEHREAMRPIMEQMWAKQTLLDALSNNPKAEPKALADLVDEISALRAKADKSRMDFAAKVKMETGYDLPYGGYAMRDRGYGYGHYGKRGGHHSGGQGRGCSWF